MGVDLLEKPMPQDLLEILNRGGIAGVVCLDTVMDTYLVRWPNRFRGIRKNQPAVTEKAYYLMFSHPFVARHPELSEKIWDTIAAIKTEDTFNAVMERYTH
jgi:polar amino acid transport system substrate-binding protein